MYDANLLCTWTFIAPVDQVVFVNFTRFILEATPVNDTRVCPYDYVKVSVYRWRSEQGYKYDLVSIGIVEMKEQGIFLCISKNLIFLLWPK